MVIDSHALVNDMRCGVHAIGHGVDKLDQSLRSEINALKAKVIVLEGHLERTKILTEKLRATDASSPDFTTRIQNELGIAWDQLHNFQISLIKAIKPLDSQNSITQDLAVLTVNFATGTSQTLKAFIRKIGPDQLADWVNINRFARLWDLVHENWHQLTNMTKLVPSVAQEGARLEQSMKRWLKPADSLKAHGSTDKQDFVSAYNAFSDDIATLIVNTGFDTGRHNLRLLRMEMLSVMNLWSNELWHDLYNALRLDKLVEFFETARKFIIAHSEYEYRLLVVATRGMKYWIKSNLDVFSVDADADLIDFLKVKFAGTDSFGTAEAGVCGGSGGGVNIRLKAFSGAGQFFGTIALLIDIVVAAATYYLNVRQLHTA